MKKVAIAVLSFALINPAGYAFSQGGSEGSAAGSGLVSAASILGSAGALQASVVSAQVIGASASLAIQGSAQIVQASTIALAHSVRIGSEMAIVSARAVGDLVYLTYRVTVSSAQFASELASAGIRLASNAAVSAFEFTITVSHAALLAAGQAVQGVTDLLHAAGRVTVKAVAITAGTAATIVGYTLVLASAPGVAVGFVLTDVGQDLLR